MKTHIVVVKFVYLYLYLNINFTNFTYVILYFIDRIIFLKNMKKIDKYAMHKIIQFILILI